MLGPSIGLIVLVFSVSPLVGQPGNDTVTEAELNQIRKHEAARIKAIDGVYGTVVAVFGNDRKGGGSGVLIDPKGFALTNHHVVAAAGQTGWAGLADGKLYRWRLCGTDPSGDLAVIQLQGRDDFPISVLADSAKTKIGQVVMAMGNPFVLAHDYTPTVTLGIISGTQRFQGGGLIYGNCIQADSSVNPGNSGGPLMNMQGRVIGINGRAAFDRRGRVNVGIAFAISSNQCKFFLPDLMSAKVAQHGTLDAQFSNRGGKVICDAINLDARIARAGLQLGDELVALNGSVIDDANQFTNLISMLPAEWPVDVTYRQDGKEHFTSVRLNSLSFSKSLPKATEPEKKPTPPEPSDDKSPKQPQRVNPRAWLQKLKPGVVRDASFNKENARHILSRWIRPTTDRTGIFEVIFSVSADGTDARVQRIQMSEDGRFVAETSDDKTIMFNGSKYRVAGKDASTLTFDNALEYPAALLATILSEVDRAQSFDKGWSEVKLDGGDRAQGRISYRLQAFKSDTPLNLWFNAFNERGEQNITLLKASLDIDGTLSRPAISFSNWNNQADAWLPESVHVVTGLTEQTSRTWRVVKVERLETPPAIFNSKEMRPSGEEDKE